MNFNFEFWIGGKIHRGAVGAFGVVEEVGGGDVGFWLIHFNQVLPEFDLPH